jgi:hypothetical protein
VNVTAAVTAAIVTAAATAAANAGAAQAAVLAPVMPASVIRKATQCCCWWWWWLVVVVVVSEHKIVSAQSLVDLSTSVGTKGECFLVREFLLFIHYDQGRARTHVRMIMP